MNKAELVDAVAKTTKTKREAKVAVDAVLESVTKALKKKESVTLVGFGTFTVRKRAARIGRNPRTGKELKIAAKTVPVFRAGKALKEAVR